MDRIKTLRRKLKKATEANHNGADNGKEIAYLLLELHYRTCGRDE